MVILMLRSSERGDILQDQGRYCRDDRAGYRLWPKLMGFDRILTGLHSGYLLHP